jgi:hypothetical protein
MVAGVVMATDACRLLSDKIDINALLAWGIKDLWDENKINYVTLK